MEGNQNLIPFNQRTMEERREIGRRAGIESGKARRRKAELRKTAEALLSMTVSDRETKEQLEAIGLKPTNEALLVLSIFQSSASGNQKAVENLLKLLGVKDEYDVAEQKARTKLIKSQAKRLEHEIANLTDGNAENQLRDYFDKLGQVIDSDNP